MRTVQQAARFRWVECPRDSWQGFGQFIPTPVKLGYLHQIVAAGFTDLDITSFVSPRWVPQMADAEAVLRAMPVGAEYLAIVANEKGLNRALQALHLSAVGYPFSISPTFQLNNTNRSIEDSWPLVGKMVSQTKEKLKLVVYLSMGFGNPYGNAWSPELVMDAVGRLRGLGVQDISIADTYGIATAQTIAQVLKMVVGAFGADGIGAHLHSRPEDTLAKVDAVLGSGVKWLEGSLGGIGGCPFAGDHLVGNLASEVVLPYLYRQGLNSGVDMDRLVELAAAAAALKSQFAEG
jgi:hydroxymethylglutaryl-CoA lyase